MVKSCPGDLDSNVSSPINKVLDSVEMKTEKKVPDLKSFKNVYIIRRSKSMHMVCTWEN